MAEALMFTPRTLRQWKIKSEKQIKKKRGRPALRISLPEQLQIAKEWKRQGYPGTRPVIHALKEVRVKAVREVVAKLKLRRKKRQDKIRKDVRKSIKVKSAGVVLSMDGATKNKGDDLVVYRDRGSLSVHARSCGGTLKSENVLEVLRKLKAENKLPLVFCTDNGAPLCSSNVKSFLQKNYIIHLKNLPHTPQHNGACENAVREFKDLLNENLKTEEAIKTLNECRLRASLNWQTSSEFEKSNFVKFKKEARQEFYESVMANIKIATCGINNAKEKRLREREEILKTMENFSLITITRGSQSRKTKAEEIS